MLILLSLLAMGAHLLAAMYGREASRESLRLLVRGSWSGFFLGGTCLVGLILPLAIGLTAFNGDGWRLAAPALVLKGIFSPVGNFCSKLSVIRAG